MSEVFTGKIKKLIDSKKYGYLTDDLGKDHYFSYADVYNLEVLTEGDMCTYKISQDDKGRNKAIHIRKIG